MEQLVALWLMSLLGGRSFHIVVAVLGVDRSRVEVHHGRVTVKCLGAVSLDVGVDLQVVEDAIAEA